MGSLMVNIAIIYAGDAVWPVSALIVGLMALSAGKVMLVGLVAQALCVLSTYAFVYRAHAVDSRKKQISKLYIFFFSLMSPFNQPLPCSQKLL